MLETSLLLQLWGTREPLRESEKESEKVGLKLNIQKMKIMASSPITSWQIDGEKVGTVTDFIFLGTKITADGGCSHEIKTLVPWKKSCEQSRQHIKKQRYYFADKGPSSQSYCFSSNHIWMWELDYKKRWVPKNWHLWTVVLENTLENPLRLQGDQTSQSLRKSTLNIRWRYWCWNSSTLATWCEEPTHWKRHRYWESWERLRTRGECEDREWDDWTARLSQWTWVFANSGR